MDAQWEQPIVVVPYVNEDSKSFPTLKQLATKAVLRNHNMLSDTQISGVLKLEIGDGLMDNISEHDAIPRFTRLFYGKGGKKKRRELCEELRKDVTLKRWSDESTLYETSTHIDAWAPGISCVCAVPGGLAFGSSSGRVVVADKYNEKSLKLGSFGSKVTHIHYYGGKLYAVFLNWQIQVWEIDDPENAKSKVNGAAIQRGWTRVLHYTDSVSGARWNCPVMSRGTWMIHSDGRGRIHRYIITPDIARATDAIAVPRDADVKHLSCSDNFYTFILKTNPMVMMGPGLNRRPRSQLILSRLFGTVGDVSSIAIENAVTRAVCVEELPKSLRVFVAFERGSVVEYSWTLIDYGRTMDFSGFRTIEPLDGYGEVEAMSASGGVIAIYYQNRKIRVFSTEKGKIIRTVDTKRYAKKQINSKKKRKVNKEDQWVRVVPIWEEGPNLNVKIHVDGQRLVWSDKAERRAHCLDFS